MTKNLLLIVAFLLLQVTQLKVFAQPEFKYGFGGGVNFSNITEVNTYALYEDISGLEYESSYSGMLTNLGSQFFFHGELWYSNFNLAFRPGVKTNKFSKTDQVTFNNEPIEQTNSYLLRYLQIPVEIKFAFGNGNFNPFLGLGVSYGHLLQQGGGGTHSFIHPKFTAGPLIGAYYSFDSFDLVLSAGYNIGLHAVTQQSNRYDTGSNTPYSQSDIKLNDLSISLSILFSVGKEDSKGALDCPAPKKTKLKKVKRK